MAQVCVCLLSHTSFVGCTGSYTIKSPMPPGNHTYDYNTLSMAHIRAEGLCMRQQQLLLAGASNIRLQCSQMQRFIQLIRLTA